MSKTSVCRPANSDGRLAYQLWEVVREDIGERFHSELYINVFTIDANGQNRRQLTSRPGHFCSPCFSPDGTKIVFSAGCDKLTLINPDGTEPVIISGDLSGCDSPAFSPDGQTMVFGARSVEGWAIFIINIDGTHLRQITRNFISHNPVFTADGRSIIYYSQGGRSSPSGLYIMDIDGSNSRPLFTQPSSDYRDLTVSPDGTKIAFTEQIIYYPEPDEYDHIYTVYVSNLDGSDLSQVTGTFRSATSPTFSPDGQRVAFVGEIDEDQEPSIYSAKLDGSDLELIAENARGVSSLTWAPRSS